MLGRCTYPTCSARSQSISSPLPEKQNQKGRSQQTPTSPRRCALSLLHHQLLQNMVAEAEGHKIKYGRRICGGNESWGDLGVRVPTRPARGRAPHRVSSLSPGGPLVRAVRRWLCPTSTAALNTRTGLGTSSRTPGWSGFGAGHRRL